jgi:hypothetical protein
MLHVNKDIKYPEQFYQHELREALILDEATYIMIWNKPIARWIVIEKNN